MHKSYQLIIFDWDGTLVDSQAQIVSCMQQTFDIVGLSQPDESLIRHTVGLSLEAVASRLAPQVDRLKIEQIAHTYRKLAQSNNSHSASYLMVLCLVCRRYANRGFTSLLLPAWADVVWIQP